MKPIINDETVLKVVRTSASPENAIQPLLRMKEHASQKCRNPFCDVEFEKSGPAVRPKRFCSPECTRTGWAVRKVADGCKALSDAEVIEIIRQER